jgi:putative transposase
MGTMGDCFDNSTMESVFGTMQIEVPDEHRWDALKQMALAMFDWIQAWYNPTRRHSRCGMLNPLDYERAHISGAAAT